MKTKIGLFCVVLFLLGLLPARSAPAQVNRCALTASLAKVSRSTSGIEILVEEKKFGSEYIFRVVASARRLELNFDPQHAAAALLSTMPKDELQHLAWLTLGDMQCDEESMQDMQALAGVKDRLPHNVSRAVILHPEKMKDYVEFASSALDDPGSEYPLEMKDVCKAKHAEFTKAVNALSSEDRVRFAHFFKVQNCEPAQFGLP